MMKVVSLLFALFLVVSTGTASAQAITDQTASITPSPATTSRRTVALTQAAARKEAAASSAAERREKASQNSIENLRSRALREIDNRLTSLSRLVTKINTLGKLTTGQKAALTASLQTEITNLTNLKAKVQADTDIETLRADAKAIVSSYRVYALYIPQIHTLTAASALLTSTQKLTDAYTELQKRVSNAKAAGVDTTVMTQELVAMQAKITDATTQTNSAIDLVTPLTPAGYPGNLALLRTAREKLSVARKDVVDASGNARKVLSLLRQTKTTATPAMSTTEETSGSSTTTTLPATP